MTYPRKDYWFDSNIKVYDLNTNTNTKTLLSAANYKIWDGDVAVTDTYQNTNSGVLFNFPSLFHISQLGLKVNGAVTGIIFSGSADSTDGIDGTWTQIMSTNLPSAVYTLTAVTEMDLTWLKATNSYSPKFCVHLFGQYVTPRFEFWASNGSAKLNTLNFPLSTPNAPNNAIFTADQAFKIKNLSGGARSYAVSIRPIRYNGDTLISNNYFLSLNGGTPATTVNITSLADGTLSQVIDVLATVSVANNLADGRHYFSVDVVETA
jgi:hypothetical protein